jgi:hypothetical protein
MSITSLQEQLNTISQELAKTQQQRDKLKQENEELQKRLQAQNPTPEASAPEEPLKFSTVILFVVLISIISVVVWLASRSTYEFTEEISLEGKITASSEFAPIVKGDDCSLLITPHEGDDQNCRVMIYCGHGLVYGAKKSGFNYCEADKAGLPVRTLDTKGSSLGSGDPLLDFDRSKGRAIISDDLPQKSYSFTISF